jgi:hypothetical protein
MLKELDIDISFESIQPMTKVHLKLQFQNSGSKMCNLKRRSLKLNILFGKIAISSLKSYVF